MYELVIQEALAPTEAVSIMSWDPQTGQLAAYAQLNHNQDTRIWGLDLIIDPSHNDRALEIGPQLLRSALDFIGEHEGGQVHWWVNKPTSTHEALAKAVNLPPSRDLLQLRRSLPLDIANRPEALALRTFRADHDEDAWLELNNRAFHWHPEQGNWNRHTLESRTQEPWFNPEGFLLHERDGRLAGFCWTKIHADHSPPLGEIYVVAVDPNFQGIGLGYSLVVAGLDWLSHQGLTTAMLYVDKSNKAALSLYKKSMGFTIDHIDRLYVAEVQTPWTPTNEPTI